MSRQARRLSETGMYHIMVQGVGKQNIFEEKSDYAKLKEILHRVKDETGFELYAYCFMTNHVHLFIKEQEAGEISLIMKKILSSYATWFNRKYARAGALFNNRYKSEPVEDERYFYGLTAYIHQNPKKANMVKSLKAYEYSSYGEYIDDDPDITDIDFMLDMLSENRQEAIAQFVELSGTGAGDDYEIVGTRKYSPGRTRRMIKAELGGAEPWTIKEMNKDERDRVLRMLVKEIGISKSELSRETGISRYIIQKACGEIKQKVLRPHFDKKPVLPAHLM